MKKEELVGIVLVSVGFILFWVSMFVGMEWFSLCVVAYVVGMVYFDLSDRINS